MRYQRWGNELSTPLVMLLTLAVTLAAACSDQDDDMVTTATQGSTATTVSPVESSESQLIEGVWWLESFNGTAVSVGENAASTPWVRLENGGLEGDTGCNSASVDYTVEDEKIHPGRIAGSMMRCTGASGRDVMQSDYAFDSFLGASEVSYSVDADVMTWTMGDKRLVFSLHHSEPSN